ncbi:MAG: hypothetical protein M1824_001172 [Vezdaea acicularis]|nr:MAG: hypothetical protein M1824_001172 [Vezdaea acicularis]
MSPVWVEKEHSKDNIKPTHISEPLFTTSHTEEVVSPEKPTLMQDNIIPSYHADEASSLTADPSLLDDVLSCSAPKAPAWVSKWKALLGASDEVFDDDDDATDAASSTSSIRTLSPPPSPPPSSLSTYPQLITDILNTEDIEADEFDKILADLETSASATANSPLNQWLQAAIADTRRRFTDPSKHPSRIGAVIYLRSIYDLLNWLPTPPQPEPVPEPPVDEPTPTSIRSAARALWQIPSPTHQTQRQELRRQERIARRLGHENVLAALESDKQALNLARLHSCQQLLLAREAANLPPTIPPLKDALNNLHILHTSHLTHHLSFLTPAQTTLLTLQPHLALSHRATAELPLLHSQTCTISHILHHSLLHTARKHATYASRLNARDVLDPNERRVVRARRQSSPLAWVYLAAAYADLKLLAACARGVAVMFEVLERELELLRRLAVGMVVRLGAVVEAL